MRKITIIGNYVNIPEESKVCKHHSSDILMFLGKMDYEPNITAVTHFVKFIFPELKKKYGQLKFLIVGARPTKDILALSKEEGVEVTGFVESTEPYFQNATVVIAPMLSGAGVQNKIIQAMSYGCCVATTTIGAEGIQLKGNEIAIFNSDHEWNEGLTRLFEDSSLRLKMGKEARQTIKDTLSKDIVFNQFKKLIDNI